MSDLLWPHGLQHAGLPFPSPTPCSNSCPLSQWCHPSTSSSVIPFSSCLQSFPASGSFPMNWFFASGVKSIIASASMFVPPVNIQDWFSFRINWLDLLEVQVILRSLLQYHSSKEPVLRCSPFFMVQLAHPYMTLGKIIVLSVWTFVSKVISLFFNTLSTFVIDFPSRSKHLLISSL